MNSQTFCTADLVFVGVKLVNTYVLIIFIVAYYADGSVVDSTNHDDTFSFTSGKNSVLKEWEEVTDNQSLNLNVSPYKGYSWYLCG